MHDNNETSMAAIKAIMIWIGALVGSITLSKLVLLVTLIYTLMQAYVLWRDKLRGGNDGKF
ncbi:hypothetical protein [Ralstonia insidiosa]|uniref:hypothetical protein n=1 Tax=Ralstonia insidiosa TaxID=190721 RepID=UPI001427D530|nr:hypothetical protein [Ralstonia insidiosa]